jgi:hypothetical protein
MGLRPGLRGQLCWTLAVTLKATLVSADPSFEKLGKMLKWVRLPKFAQ